MAAGSEADETETATEAAPDTAMETDEAVAETSEVAPENGEIGSEEATAGGADESAVGASTEPDVMTPAGPPETEQEDGEVDDTPADAQTPELEAGEVASDSMAGVEPTA